LPAASPSGRFFLFQFCGGKTDCKTALPNLPSFKDCRVFFSRTVWMLQWREWCWSLEV
jgi:hypothetical protein